jgi:N-acetylated-alpha-linked acidic dipeptidase
MTQPKVIFSTSTSLIKNLELDTKSLKDYIKFENIQKNLRDISSQPHVAGTPSNLKVAQTIAEKWKSAGLENVHFKKYTVLLSYPNYTDPNHARIYDNDGNKVFESKGVSPPLIPKEQDAPNAGLQWLAYSANGIAMGNPVYCHYGRQKDFDYLKNMGISVKDKIVLIRYGGAFRGDTVRIAGSQGAVGVILFSDPFDVAADGTEKAHTYPNTDWMPNEATQQGTVKNGDGDIFTPFYPAKPELYSKLTVDDVNLSRYNLNFLNF